MTTPLASRSIRLGKRPAKSLFFMWAKKDLRRLKPVKTALDLACGAMYFRPFLPARRYIGVDVLQERLDAGRQRHPDVETICGKIEDLTPGVTADIVICFETFGINSWFDNTATMHCVEKMIRATNKGGTALLNLGPAAARWHEPVVDRFRKSFAAVAVKRYGRWSFETNPLVSYALAWLMRLVPKLRTDGSSPRIYIRAEHRR